MRYWTLDHDDNTEMVTLTAATLADAKQYATNGVPAALDPDNTVTWELVALPEGEGTDTWHLATVVDPADQIVARFALAESGSHRGPAFGDT